MILNAIFEISVRKNSFYLDMEFREKVKADSTLIKRLSELTKFSPRIKTKQKEKTFTLVGFLNKITDKNEELILRRMQENINDNKGEDIENFFKLLLLRLGMVEDSELFIRIFQKMFNCLTKDVQDKIRLMCYNDYLANMQKLEEHSQQHLPNPNVEYDQFCDLCDHKKIITRKSKAMHRIAEFNIFNANETAQLWINTFMHPNITNDGYIMVLDSYKPWVMNFPEVMNVVTDRNNQRIKFKIMDLIDHRVRNMRLR